MFHLMQLNNIALRLEHDDSELSVTDINKESVVLVLHRLF